jgi:Uma2 family endonuclease
MSLHIPTSSRPEVTPPIVYPESDGEPLAETEVHILAIIDFIATLRFHYRSRRDIYVIGNMFLYYEEGNPRARKAPDLMVVKRVDTSQPRRIFKVWEEKAVPCVIIEFTSKSTCEEDQGDKKAVYAHLGVREYFLFDPLHEYLDQPFEGYRLIGQEYVPMEAASAGGIVSEELGLRLLPEGGLLRLYDLKKGARVLAPQEWYDVARKAQEQARQELERADKAELFAQQEQQRAEKEKQRAEKEKQRAEKEKQRAEKEKQRADTAEAEAARLRALLEKLQKKKD